MKPNSLLCLLLLLLSFAGVTQPPVFNKIITFTDTLKQEDLFQAIEVNDGYLLAGNVFTIDQALNTEYIALAIVKLDRQGNLLSKRIYGDTSHSFQCAFMNSFVRTGDGNLVLPLTVFRNSHDPHWYIRLMKITPDGDSISTALVNDTAQNTFGMSSVSGMVRAADKGFGLLANVSGVNLFMKTDTTGHVSWSAPLQCDNSWQSLVNSVFPLPDNSFMIGYQCVTDNTNFNGYFAHMDTAGNTLWKDLNYGTQEDDMVMAFSTNDSSYFGFSSVESNGDPANKMFVLDKGDNTGITLSRKTFGPGNHWFSPRSNVRLPDSTWLATGDVLYDAYAWITNYDDSGNEVFYKEYTPPGFASSKATPTAYWGFYATIPTTDDGLLSIGYFRENASSFGRPWIVKTDRYG